MAGVDLFGNPVNDNPYDTGPHAPDPNQPGMPGTPGYPANGSNGSNGSGSNGSNGPIANPFNSSAPAPTDAAQAAMINRDKESWYNQIQAAGGNQQNTQSGLDDVVRQLSYASNAGKDPGQYIKEAIAKINAGLNNQTFSQGGRGGSADVNYDGIADTAQRSGGGSGGSGGGAGGNFGGASQWPGFQFNDPYTKLYEDVARRNLESLQGQNDQFQQLMGFLNKQFTSLSNSNGYSPEELAILNTQALEPIEAQRQAAQQRELQRTSRAGYLPSSGITLDQQSGIDRNFDQMRTAANRDLAVNNINERTNRLNQALNLGQLAVSIPDARNAQALNVANSLYQLPRNAMNDAQGVINGSSPTAALSPMIQLLSQAMQQQQYGQQNSAAMFGQLGTALYELLNGHR